MRNSYYHIIKLLTAVTLLFMGQGLLAQSLSIQGELDKSEMKTGEQAAVNLIIRTDNLAETRFRLSNDGSERRFEVLELGALDTTKLDEKLLEIKARLLITSFDSTLVRIPPIIAETPIAIDSTQSFALNVIQPKVDVSKPNEFKGIKAPWTVDLTWRDILDMILSSWILWFIIALHLFGFLLLIARYFYLRRDVNSPEEESKAKVLTPIETFDQSVKLIEERHYIEQGNFKTYYTLLIEALKTYLDSQMNLMTLEQTSNEVLQSLKESNYPTKELNALETVFRLSDLSKFAKSKPSEEEAKYSMEVVTSFVHSIQNREDEKKAEALRNTENQ